MHFNGLPLMAMLMLLLAITIVAIMAKISILSILAMALNVINMAIRGIQLKGHEKTRSMMLNSYQLDLLFRLYQYVFDFVIFTALSTM